MNYVSAAQQVVAKAIADLNESLPPGQKIDIAAGTALLGEGGGLDSMGFVDLAVCIQETVFDIHGVAITVADESMLNGETPFSTIYTLTKHVARLLENAHQQ